MEFIRSLTSNIWLERNKIFRFLISGGAAAGTNLFILYAVTEWFGIWYLLSSVIAFIIAFFVSFVLQKYWTFKDHSTDMIHRQMVIYFAYALLGVLVNTLFVYIFVEIFGIHYFVAQFISSGLIAIANFFVYRFFIFKE
jgi:putative flippase GtrA